jgi:hypothetical protein
MTNTTTPPDLSKIIAKHGLRQVEKPVKDLMIEYITAIRNQHEQAKAGEGLHPTKKLVWVIGHGDAFDELLRAITKGTYEP